MRAERYYKGRELIPSLAQLDTGYPVDISAPALVRCNGFRNPSTLDFGILPLFAAADPSNGQVNSLLFRGPNLFLPYPGRWFLKRAYPGVASPATPITADSTLSLSLLENETEDRYLALCNDTHPTSEFSCSPQAIPPATSTPIDATGAADLYLPDGSLIANGRFCHINGLHLTNGGANGGFLHFGRGDLGATQGISVATNTTIFFPPGQLSGMSALYFYSTLGCTLRATWFVK